MNNNINITMQEVVKTKHIKRMAKVQRVDKYLQGYHNVLGRKDFKFKNKEYKSAKIVLQSIKPIIDFHSGYICANPVSLTGDNATVGLLNKVYKKSLIAMNDLQIATELLKYGDAFEYVYINNQNEIASIVMNGNECFPVTDENGEYVALVQKWQDVDTLETRSIVYYHDVIVEYVGEREIKRSHNISGLPVWYSSIDKDETKIYGESFVVDLVEIMDAIEYLLSKLDDAVTTLSMNPLGVATGQAINSGTINKDVCGVVLNMEDGGSFSYASAIMDKESVKLELDTLMQQFYSIACVPSSVIGQNNISNVSEVSMTMLYQQCDNLSKRYILAMKKGFSERLNIIRRLLALQNVFIEDDDFDSIDYHFNLNKPIDSKTDMENMKMQYDMGAISRQTIIDKSIYTGNTALELERIAEEKQNNVADHDVTAEYDADDDDLF